jgi:hypothetical protein
MPQVVTSTFDSVAQAVGKTISGTFKIVEAIVANPLPAVTMVAATWALGPAGLTQAGIVSSTSTAAALASGTIAAAQGKNIGQIAQSALLAYGGSNFAEFTGAGDFTASVGESIGGTTGLAVQQGLNNAFFNSSVAALGGKDVGQAFGAGFVGGAAGSVAGSAMSSEMGQSFFGSVKDSFGLDDSQMKYIQGASQAMGTAAISGQDPQLALTNYIARNIVNVGKTELGKSFTSAKDSLVTSKQNLEQEEKNQEQIINQRNSLYEEAKTDLSKYNSLSEQYKDAANNIMAANKGIESNRSGYDIAIAAYNNDAKSLASLLGLRVDTSGTRVGTYNENGGFEEDAYASSVLDMTQAGKAGWANGEAKYLKPYTDVVDKYRPIIEDTGSQLKALNTKLTDYSTKINGFDEQIKNNNTKISQLSDSFSDAAAKFEAVSKEVGSGLVETAKSDIKTAENAKIEEARQEAARQEQAKQEALAEEARQQAAALETQRQAEAEAQKQAEAQRQEAARQAEEARAAAQAEADRQAELARTQRDEEERAKAEELHRIAQEEADKQAEIARQAEADRQAKESKDKSDAEQTPPTQEPKTEPPPVKPPAEVPGEDGGTLTIDPNTGKVDVQEPELPTEPEIPTTELPPTEPETPKKETPLEESKTEPVTIPGEDGGTLTVDPKTGAVDAQEPATELPPGAVYDTNDTDIGSEVGSETVTTSPGEEPLADLTKSGVMMPDGSYKTWAELDELAGVPPGTIYTDGGTTITEQELLDILNGTYTNPKQVPKPGAGTNKPTTPAPKPTTPAPKPTTQPTTQPVTQPTTQPTQQNNPLGMLALLDILGQPQQQQIQQPQQQGADIRLMENIFGTDFDTPRPEGTKKYSSGGEIEALLHLLRS